MLSNSSTMRDNKYYSTFLLKEGKRLDVRSGIFFSFNLDSMLICNERRDIFM